MTWLAEEAKILRARVAELEEAMRTRALSVPEKRKTVDLEVFSKQARIERAKHMARIAQLENGLHERKGKLDFLKRRNDVLNSHYSILGDECDSLKLQISNG